MIGTTLASGRYELVAILGEGAQGTTFEATDREAGRTVAIKRFSVRGAKSWKDVELAEREASVLSSLTHPSLPKYLAHFEEDGALYLVMDKIEGRSLAELMRKGTVLGRSDVAQFLSDAAQVLGFLRGRAPPVIHRDINPKNVIRRPDGSYAFVDFGAVRDRLKAHGSTVVGTFGYMAPEQFQGRALPASDVYAVGATALSMLCGTEPENLPHKGLSIDVAAALGERKDHPLVRLLERMLEPDPDRRLSNLAELGSLADSATGAGARRPPSAARKAERRPRDRRGRRRGARPQLAPLMLFVALMGLGIASIAVSVALLLAVPVVLTLLSIFLGPKLREAAGAVRHAGQASNRALARARGYLLERARDDRRRARAKTRIDAERPPPDRARVEDEPESEAADVDVADVEADEAGSGRSSGRAARRAH